MAIKIALQLYTLRNEMAADFEGTLKLVSEMGYEGVEFAGLFGKTAGEVKDLLAKYNLVPVSAHISLVEFMTGIDQVLDLYKEIGFKYVAVPFLPVEDRPESGNFDKTIENIRSIGEKAAAKDMVLLYHNHDFEFTKFNGEYYLDTLYSSIPAQYLQTELDTCWVNVGGEDPVAYIRKYSGRAPIVHLKDFVMKGKGTPSGLYELIGIKPEEKMAEEESFGFRPIGSGVQNIPEIMKASEEAGAIWAVVEQDRPAAGMTPLQSATLSKQYLTSIGY